MNIIERIKSTRAADLAERVVATFVEAFAGVFVAGLAVGMNQTELKALVAAGAAAGLAAVKTLLKLPPQGE